MKNYIFTVMVLFAVVFTCSGCGKDINTKEETEFSTESLAEQGLESKPEEGVDIVLTPDEFTSPKENQEYQEEFDDQYWVGAYNLWHEAAAETGDSCYFMLDGFLYVYDREEKQAALLCGDPTCPHTLDSDCNALVSSRSNNFLEYYNGYLYTFIVNQEMESGILKETLNLYRISLDGTTKDFVATVASAVAVAGSAYNTYNVYTMVIHRGYLYYMYGYGFGEDENSYYVNRSHVLYRISLDNPEEPEAICAMNYGGVCSLIHLEGHGSYLYFIQTGKENQMYRYNTESDQLEYIDIEEPEFYVVYQDWIIYYRVSEPDKYFYYNPETQEEGVFSESGEDYFLGFLTWDGTYFNRKLGYGDDFEFNMTICDENLNEISRYDYSWQGLLHEFCFRGINIMASNDTKEWLCFDKTDENAELQVIEVKK